MAGYGPGRPPAPWFLRSTCCPTWRLPYWVFQAYFFWSWLRRSQRLYEKGFKLLRQFPYNEELVSDSRNEHLHFSDKAVLNKCYKIGTWCSTKVKLGSMEFSSSKESKEVNLTSVVSLVQELFNFRSKISRVFGAQFDAGQLVFDTHHGQERDLRPKCS